MPSQIKLTLKNSDPSSEQGYLYALRLLAGRDYGSVRIKEKLLAREYTETDVEAIVARLKIEGWIDDRRFGERFAESAIQSGRFYGQRLKLEMRRRGIPEALVDEVLEQVHSVHDERDGARSVMTHRFPNFCFAQATDKERRRVIGFLQRRGFGFSTIMHILKNAED